MADSTKRNVLANEIIRGKLLYDTWRFKPLTELFRDEHLPGIQFVSPCISLAPGHLERMYRSSDEQCRSSAI